MKETYYPELDETVLRQTLPCGLRVEVVPRKGFTKSLPTWRRTSAPSTRTFSWTVRSATLRRGPPTIWNTSCLICPTAPTSPGNLPPWGRR